MRIRKVLCLLLFPFITDVVISCCPCEDATIAYYTNKKITAEKLDNSGSTAVPVSSDTLLREAYGIRVTINREKTAKVQTRWSLFLQPAYAFSCDCGPYYQVIARDSITAIQVFTVNDFDASHAAGSDVSGYFRVLLRNNFFTTDNFLKNYDSNLYDDGGLEDNFSLLLMTAPPADHTQQFRVRLSLSDGRFLETETKSIYLI